MTPAPVTFNATLHSSRHDAEGEWKVTLTVPSSEVAAMVRLCTYTEHGLKVTVTLDPLTVAKGRFVTAPDENI